MTRRANAKGPRVEHDGRGLHRIVDDGGEGDWTTYGRIARYRDLYAATQYYEGTLPVGVPFRVSIVE